MIQTVVVIFRDEDDNPLTEHSIQLNINRFMGKWEIEEACNISENGVGSEHEGSLKSAIWEHLKYLFL
jgi:hypothetical protein